MAKNVKTQAKIPLDLQPWIEARQRFRLEALGGAPLFGFLRSLRLLEERVRVRLRRLDGQHELAFPVDPAGGMLNEQLIGALRIKAGRCAMSSIACQAPPMPELKPRMRCLPGPD
jgi:hypothetical protein